MLVHFQKFIANRESPGLIPVPSWRSIGSVIEGLLLVWLNWTPSGIKNLAVWLPSLLDEN